MINLIDNYREVVLKKVNDAFAQESKLKLGSTWIADCLIEGGWIYTSGTGHSHLLAEEIFYRAGGFARIIPILDPDLMLHVDATGSTELERKEGYAAELLSSYAISAKDVFILSSNSGRNAVSIEMAQLASQKGAKVIAITNYTHSKSVNSRHSSGKKLYEIADVYLDNFGEIGDAAIPIPGLHAKMGATSTVVGAALLHAMMIQAATICIEHGITPEVFNSSNSDGGEEYNAALIEKYKAHIAIL